MIDKALLPDRVKTLLQYLAAGNAVEFEGRQYVLDPETLFIGARAIALKFSGGEPTETMTVIGVNMSLHRFLEMALTLTYGDYDRMKHVMEDRIHANY